MRVSGHVDREGLSALRSEFRSRSNSQCRGPKGWTEVVGSRSRDRWDDGSTWSLGEGW